MASKKVPPVKAKVKVTKAQATDGLTGVRAKTGTGKMSSSARASAKVGKKSGIKTGND